MQLEGQDGNPRPAAAPRDAPTHLGTWDPPVIKAWLDSLLPYMDRYLKLRENEQRFEMRISAAEGTWDLKITRYLLVFAGLVIAAMAGLTFSGQVSGDALLFLVGTVVGALFTMIHRQLFEGRTEQPPPEQ